MATSEPGKRSGPRGLRVQSAFFAPPSEFDGCFTSFYHLSLTMAGNGDGAVTDHLQPEWSNIRFFTGTAPHSRMDGQIVEGTHFTATGPSSAPVKFTLGPCEMWGIGFLPLGWARFMDCEASAMRNVICDGNQHAAFRKFTPLAEVLCDATGDKQQQFDAIVDFMREHMRPSRDDAKILRVHNALIDTNIHNVTELAEVVEMSIRALERLCARQFGFSPKLLLRRQRFMRSLSTFMLHHGTNWTDAMDDHYHDQAQFTREFRAFMKMSPSAYAALDHPILSSFMEARARLWGSPVQTLDKPK